MIHHRTTATYDHQRTIATSLHALKTDRKQHKQHLSCNKNTLCNAFIKTQLPLNISLCFVHRQCKISVIHHRTTDTYDHQRTIATSLHALKTDRKQRFTSCNEHPFATPLHKRPPKAQIQIAPTGKQRKRRLCFLGIVFRLFIW